MMDILEIITTTEVILVIAIQPAMVVQAPTPQTVQAAALMHIHLADTVGVMMDTMAMIAL